MSPVDDESGGATAAPDRVPAVRARKPRGCLKKIVLLILIGLPIGVWLLNGPLFRALAEWGIAKAAASQGLEGEAEVNGTLLGGFGLTQVRFTGGAGSPVRRLSIEASELRYNVRKLITDGGLGWIEGVRVAALDVELELPEGDQAPEKDKAAPEESEPKEAGDLEMLWGLLGTRFEFLNLNAKVIQGDKVYEVKGLTLVLPENGEGSLEIGSLAVPGQETRTDIETGIRLTPSTIAVGPLEVVEPVTLKEVVLQRESGGEEPFLNAALTLAGGDLEASYGPGNRITVSLVSGGLDVPSLLEMVGREDLAGAEVTRLDAAFEGDFVVPETWRISLNAAVEGIAWKEIAVDSVTIEGATRPGAEADEIMARLVQGETEVSAEAAFQLAGVTEAKALADLTTDVSLTVAVPNLADALTSNLGESAENIPLAGAFGGSGKVRVANKALVSAEADFRSEDLAYAEVPIEAVAVKAGMENVDTVAFEVEARLDEGTSLITTGNFLPEPMTYDARAEVDALAGGRLQDLLAALGIDKQIAGKADVTWRGKRGAEGPGAPGRERSLGRRSAIWRGYAFLGRTRGPLRRVRGRRTVSLCDRQ